MNILITGVSSGIGHAIASDLSRDHEQIVYGISRRRPEDLDIHWSHVDLSQRESRQDWLDAFLKEGVKLDAIILNAGMGHFDCFGNIPIASAYDTIETNLTANIHLLYSLLPVLQEETIVIFIGSRASRRFMRGGAVYQASKFGLRGLAGAIRAEFPRFHVHYVNPSIVRTEFFSQSKTQILGNFPETSMEDILQTIRNIIQNQENRWEIDL